MTWSKNNPLMSDHIAVYMYGNSKVFISGNLKSSLHYNSSILAYIVNIPCVGNNMGS